MKAVHIDGICFSLVALVLCDPVCRCASTFYLLTVFLCVFLLQASQARARRFCVCVCVFAAHISAHMYLLCGVLVHVARAPVRLHFNILANTLMCERL